MAKEKSCTDCVYYWRDGSGYSDWTWMETNLRCALALAPWDNKEEPHEGTLPEMAFAKECPKYEDCSYHGEPVLISPDGHLDKGEDRAAELIRKLSK